MAGKIANLFLQGNWSAGPPCGIGLWVFMKREKPNISISFPVSKKVKTVDSQVLKRTNYLASPSKLFDSNASSAFTQNTNCIHQLAL